MDSRLLSSDGEIFQIFLLFVDKIPIFLLILALEDASILIKPLMNPLSMPKTLSFLPQRLALLLFAALWAANLAASSARMEKPAFYARYERLSTPQLMAKAKEFHHKRQLLDSALVCYTVVANRLVDGTLAKSDYHQCCWAMLQLGNLYTSAYNKWDVGDDYLRRALKMAQENNFHDLLPYIYGNIANTDFTNDAVNHRPNAGENYLQKERQVFSLSIRERKWDVVATSFYNMAVYTLNGGDWREIGMEIKRFGQLRIPPNVSMYRESMLFHQVGVACQRRDYARAIRLLEDYRPGSDSLLKPAVEQMVLTSLVHLYNETGQRQKALRLIGRIEQEARRTSNSVKQYSAYELIANYWSSRGDSLRAEHYDYLKLKAKERLNEDQNMSKMRDNRFLNEISQINSSLKAETAKKRLVTLILVLAAIALTVIAVLLILQVRASRAQKRYVDLLYRRNQQLLANNQLLVAVDHPEPEEPSRQKPVELPAGIVEAIERVMGQTEVICRDSFSMSTLCQLTGFNRNYVSQAIRDKYDTNFKGLLNSYRIKEACRRMADPHYDSITIEAIAAQLGYSSRTYFSAVFKKVVGMSAAEYIRRIKQN